MIASFINTAFLENIELHGFVSWFCIMSANTGFVDFHVPSVAKPCSIWYKISGCWPPKTRPLLILHGGPGFTHDYLASLEDLTSPPWNLSLIFFDQLGSGKSTHLPEKYLDRGFWIEQLFLDQVTAVIRHLNVQDDYNMLGHSWGGMLASSYAAKNPQGLKNLVLANTPVSGGHWLSVYKKYRDSMPKPHREILEMPRTLSTCSDDAYLSAMEEFNRRHFIQMKILPPDLLKSYEDIASDRTVTVSTLGPDEFSYDGFIEGWSIISEIGNITSRTILINGENEGADDESMRIWTQKLQNCAGHVKFSKSTHMPHWEEREKFMDAVGRFVTGGIFVGNNFGNIESDYVSHTA